MPSMNLLQAIITLGAKNGFRIIFLLPAYLQMHPTPFTALAASSLSLNKISFNGTEAKLLV